MTASPFVNSRTHADASTPTHAYPEAQVARHSPSMFGTPSGLPLDADYSHGREVYNFFDGDTNEYLGNHHMTPTASMPYFFSPTTTTPISTTTTTTTPSLHTLPAGHRNDGPNAKLDLQHDMYGTPAYGPSTTDTVSLPGPHDLDIFPYDTSSTAAISSAGHGQTRGQQHNYRSFDSAEPPTDAKSSASFYPPVSSSTPPARLPATTTATMTESTSTYTDIKTEESPSTRG
ncbi:hypothetical protein F5Y19DRAFT_435538 [Xylariaceae sp. FL1651]|nr:hypothetical protein F5Y19DRAFT_435538 [Xylariaceae sp. FL1651]